MMQAVLLLMPLAVAAQELEGEHNSELQRTEERVTFQTGQPWTPRTNLNADCAIVYGLGTKQLTNLQSWRDHGFTADLMTGVAWGSYQEYLGGRFDGQKHLDQAQTDAKGNPILHGGDKNIPYISPGTHTAAFSQRGFSAPWMEGLNLSILKSRNSGLTVDGKEILGGMEELLWRRLATAQFLSGCPVPRLKVKVLSLQKGSRASLRLSEAIWGAKRADHSQLCGYTLLDQLCQLENCKSRVFVA